MCLRYYSTLCNYAPPKETKIESVGFGFFFCRPGSLIARKKMIAFRKKLKCARFRKRKQQVTPYASFLFAFYFCASKSPCCLHQKKPKSNLSVLVSFFCRPGSLIARKKMIAFRKNSNARGSENASNKSRLMLHSSLRFIFAQAKAPVVSTNKKKEG